MTSLIIPERIATQSVRRGRAVLAEIIYRCDELVDKGKTPKRITISTALKDDLSAFFEHATQWDGVLPPDLCGCPIVYVPGAGRDIDIACDGE